MLEIESREQVELVKYYADARNRAAEEILDEKRRTRVADIKRPWGVYNSSLDAYSKTFNKVLDGSKISDLIEERKKEVENVFTLDVMGQGRFYQEAAIDGEVAITLVDFRSKKLRRRDKAKNMRVVDGDVLDAKAWQEVDLFMKINKERMNGGFDFVFCRPVGGYGIIFPDRPTGEFPMQAAEAIQYSLVNKIFRRLSPTGGVMLMDVEVILESDEWISQINNLPGIVAENYKYLIRIEKFTDSLQNLPTFPRI